jgi:nucleoid DNA-binding protein
LVSYHIISPLTSFNFYRILKNGHKYPGKHNNST